MKNIHAIVVTMMVSAVLPVFASIEMGAPFTDGAVLQREMAQPVWGRATPGLVVTVEFAGQKTSTTVAADGGWRVNLRPLTTSSKPQTMRVTEAESGLLFDTTVDVCEIRDLLVGEVWFASGQSNMECPIWGGNTRYRDANGALVTAMDRLPEVRYVSVENAWSVTPREQKAVWRKFMPEDVHRGKALSAVAYYYARELHLALDIPIGIVAVNWGGTCIDAWIPRCGYEGCDASIRAVAERRIRKPGEWTAQDRIAPFYSEHHQPTVLWNGMVGAFAPMAMRGFIWYQGCCNSGEPQLYCAKLHALYKGWSQSFENPNYKFYLVQLAPFTGNWIGICNAQNQFVREEKNAAIAVTADKGNFNDIHPNQKEIVAKRLAVHALKRDYGFAIPCDDSPVVSSVTFGNGRATLKFENAKSFYVYADDRSRAAAFELSENGQTWHPAKIVNFRQVKNAKGEGVDTDFIDGDTIVLASDRVSSPSHVRYMVRNRTMSTIYNEMSLPLGPFEDPLLTIAPTPANPLCAVARPDALEPIEFHHGELGGPIDDKVMNLVSNHYLKIDFERRWISRFRNRAERGKHWRYEGVGKLLDAGSLLMAYSRDPVVAARTRELLEGLRATRDPDGYIGFWKAEPGHREEYVNWTVHEQEYLLLGQVRYYLCTGDPQALDDARKMADFMLSTFPTKENGLDAKHPAHLICTAGLPEAFLTLYRATGVRKYLDFAANVKHGCDQGEVKCMSLRDWEQGIGEFPNHVYVMTARCNAQMELYRFDGSEKLLTMSQRMLDALFTPQKGGMLVTGSCSQNEHFTYNQDGAGAVGESCVTAYMLRWLESRLRLDGNFAIGDVLERTAYNALFGATSPDGSRIRYFTPLTGKRGYDNHDGGFCCCGNFRRALAELPKKVGYVTKDGMLAMNLYAPFRKAFTVNGKTFTLRCETEYPSEGEVRYVFETAAEVPLAFRVPHWASGMTVAVNDGQPQAAKPNDKRLSVVRRSWQAGDRVTLKLPMRVRTVRGREKQAGRFSILRGPQVYCLGTNANAVVFARHPDFRSLRVDPTSLGEPIRDDSIRPNGRKILGRAWTDSSGKGESVEVVFTEYPDPSGIETFFLGAGQEEDELGQGVVLSTP